MRFILRLPLWSVREALERLGFDFTKVVFTGVVGGTILYFMFEGNERSRALEKLVDWLAYAVPATILVFAAYVSWVTLSAVRAYLRKPSEFRFEALERNNFVETFNRAKGIVIDGGEF